MAKSPTISDSPYSHIGQGIFGKRLWPVVYQPHFRKVPLQWIRNPQMKQNMLRNEYKGVYGARITRSKYK